MLKKKGKFLAIFVIIISSLLLLSGCLGETTDDVEEISSQDGSIKGQLKDFNENYAASGLVVLENENGEELERQYAEAQWEGNADAEEDTIAGGGFEFTNLEDGEYTLSINKLGYNTETRAISVINGESQVLDPIVLEPKTDFANTSTTNSISHIVVNSVPEDVNKASLTKALSLSIDTGHIVNNIYSDEDRKVPERYLPPAVAGNNQIELVNNFDLEKANNIITEQNIKLTFYYFEGSGNYLELINYLKNQWSQLDNLTVEFISYNENDDYTPGEYNLIKSGWILDNPDPLFNLKEIANYTGASEAAKNKLDEAKLKLDNETEAMELIYEAEKIMIDNGHFIVLSHYLY